MIQITEKVCKFIEHYDLEDAIRELDGYEDYDVVDMLECGNESLVVVEVNSRSDFGSLEYLMERVGIPHDEYLIKVSW